MDGDEVVGQSRCGMEGVGCVRAVRDVLADCVSEAEIMEQRKRRTTATNTEQTLTCRLLRPFARSAVFWGAGAGLAVSLFMGPVPLFQKDVLRKFPVVSRNERATRRGATFAGAAGGARAKDLADFRSRTTSPTTLLTVTSPSKCIESCFGRPGLRGE